MSEREAAERLLNEVSLFPRTEGDKFARDIEVVAKAYLSLLSALPPNWREIREECARAAAAAAWKHVGDDAYSVGMDRGAAHQLIECVKAIRALPAPPCGLIAEGTTEGDRIFKDGRWQPLPAPPGAGNGEGESLTARVEELEAEVVRLNVCIERACNEIEALELGRRDAVLRLRALLPKGGRGREE